MSDDYDPAADGAGSYLAALAAKKARGDTHYPEHRRRLATCEGLGWLVEGGQTVAMCEVCAGTGYVPEAAE